MKPRFCGYFWGKLGTRKCFITNKEFGRGYDSKVGHTWAGSLRAQTLCRRGREADSSAHAVPFNTRVTSLLHWALALSLYFTKRARTV